MDDLQIIHSPKGEEMVVLPRKEYERLVKQAYDEDAHDAALAREQLGKIKAGKTALIPLAAVKAELKGMHPVRALREWRNLTADNLAKKAGLSRITVTHIENRTRKGTVENYKAIAEVLGVGLDSVVE